MSTEQVLLEEDNLHAEEQQQPSGDENYNDSSENFDQDYKESHDENDDLESETDEESEEKKGMPDHMKKHFRRQERKLKKELKRLQSENQQYRAYLDTVTTQHTPQQHVEEQAVDEVSQKVQEVLAAERQRSIEQAQYQQVTKMRQEFESALEQGEDRYEDFDEVVHNESVPFTQTMVEVAHFLPNAADVLYKLGKNVQEAQRISHLSIPEQAKAMWKHSIELGTSSPKKVSSAPAPAQGQLRSRPATPANTDTMSYEQLKAHYKQRR